MTAPQKPNYPAHADDVFDVPGAARYLHVSESTIRKMVCNDEIPYVKLGVRRYIFSKRRIDDWVYGLSTTPKGLGTRSNGDATADDILSSIRSS